MMPLDYDELNQLVGFKKSLPFDEYFDEMVIDNKQNRQRKDLAEDLEEEFWDLLAWVFYDRQVRSVGRDEIRDRVSKLFHETLPDDILALDRTDDMIDNLSEEIARTTDERKEDPFYVSADRARLLAEDNSNNFWNYSDNEAALMRGKKYKVWNAILDGKERKTHRDADGQEQPIEEPFEVGGYAMMYPKDDSYGAPPEEIINCRCSVTYF